ncbi:glutamyl-tRNA reductase [Endothiovibrio diazotrophicus]
MPLLAVGINHKTAPVNVRERVAFSPDRLPDALRQLVALPAIEEAAILSTCNRTEVYCEVSEEGKAQVTEWLRTYHQLPREDFIPYLYVHPDRDAVRHILRVASGLDSLVLGEPQILGQIKDAYQKAGSAGTMGGLLGRLFQHTFSVAKKVRTDTAIGASAVSVAFASVSLARQIFGDLASQKALLVGAGETIELVARHLFENGIGNIIIANRTAERAHTLAQQFDGFAIALQEIPAHLADADIVISSTAAPLPILGKGMVERALRERKHRPMFMVDIAVPRDIEPEVAELEDIYLYTVDDLQEVIDEGRRSREEAAKQAEEIIDTQVEHFMEWLTSLQSVATIRAFRDNAERTAEEVLHQARRQLMAGKEPFEVLQWYAHTLNNKLLHEPTVRLRQAAVEGRQEILAAASELFQLENG